jgi:hypothetical protein
MEILRHRDVEGGDAEEWRRGGVETWRCGDIDMAIAMDMDMDIGMDVDMYMEGGHVHGRWT